MPHPILDASSADDALTNEWTFVMLKAGCVCQRSWIASFADMRTELDATISGYLSVRYKSVAMA